MQSIGNGIEVLEYLTVDRTLLSSQLKRFEIYQDIDGVAINFYFRLLYTKADVLLSFKGVTSYGFYHNSDHYFYSVESLKFLTADGMFYISIDPYHTEGISEEDNNFVLSKSLKGFIEEDNL